MMNTDMKFKIGTLVNLNTQEYTASAAGRLAAMEKIAANERMQEHVKENIMKIMHKNPAPAMTISLPRASSISLATMIPLNQDTVTDLEEAFIRRLNSSPVRKSFIAESSSDQMSSVVATTCELRSSAEKPEAK